MGGADQGKRRQRQLTRRIRANDERPGIAPGRFRLRFSLRLERRPRPPRWPAAGFTAAAAPMDFPAEIKTTARRVPSVVRTTEEAIKLIDRELLPEMRSMSRWTFARELLVVAQQSGKKRDLTLAYRQFRQALSNDKMIDEHPVPSK
jgi:hypothetical protein